MRFYAIPGKEFAVQSTFGPFSPEESNAKSRMEAAERNSVWLADLLEWGDTVHPIAG